MSDEITTICVLAVTGDTYRHRHALHAAGMVWSRDEQAYLMHTLDTRVMHAVELADGLGLTTHEREVDPSALEPESYVERRERLQGKKMARAEKHLEIAARQDKEADRRMAEATKHRGDIAYYTQPIVRGSAFHRQRERDWANQDKAGALYNEAAERRAKAYDLEAGATADCDQTLAFMQNRIDETEANCRRAARNLEKHGDYQCGDNRMLSAHIAEYEGIVAYWRGLMEQKGGLVDVSQIKAGDLVKVRGNWGVVAKVNPKTVTVAWPEVCFDLKYNHAEIQEHRPNPNPPAPKPKALPMLNRSSAPMHMTKAEWQRAQRQTDSARGYEFEGVRARGIYRVHVLYEVFITDMKEKLA